MVKSHDMYTTDLDVVKLVVFSLGTLSQPANSGHFINLTIIHFHILGIEYLDPI